MTPEADTLFSDNLNEAGIETGEKWKEQVHRSVSKFYQANTYLMTMLTNLVGDTWQPEVVENLAHGSLERQDRFIQKVLAILNDAKAAGVVVDWEQIDPAYKKDITAFLDREIYQAFTQKPSPKDRLLKFAGACAEPGCACR